MYGGQSGYFLNKPRIMSDGNLIGISGKGSVRWRTRNVVKWFIILPVVFYGRETWSVAHIEGRT